MASSSLKGIRSGAELRRHPLQVPEQKQGGKYPPAFLTFPPPFAQVIPERVSREESSFYSYRKHECPAVDRGGAFDRLLVRLSSFCYHFLLHRLQLERERTCAGNAKTEG